MTGIDFSNVSFEKITSIKYMFADCFMEEFSYTIPKTITNIQGFLSGCSNLKTLRNFHIESNVVVTDWLLNSPIENLIDCTFYNQNSTFAGVTTLKKIEDVKYLTGNFMNYFEGCISLQTALITIPNNVTKTNSLFKNCPELTRVEFTSESDMSGVTTINDMFNGDTKLSTIVNMKITNPNTSANTTTLTGCPINNTDGLYLNSNSVMAMFRMGAESRITKFTDFELGENANNLYDLFMDYPNLIEDIELPLHVVNVSNMFKNCLKMENVHSNWSKAYIRNQDDDLSNDVITSGCYEGCDNIKYIDGDLYMNEYGELTAMSVIPPDWGGKMTFEDDQTAFDIKIEADTDMAYTMLGEVGEYKTDWGDGIVDMNTTHTYERPGVYTIVTYNVDTFGIGSVLDSSISLPIVRFRFLNKSKTNGSHLFDGFENMLQLDKLEGNTFNSYEYMFNNCSKLKDVDLGGCTFSQSVKDMSYMFNNCRRFTINPINIIPDSVTNITNLYYNTEIKDLTRLTIGSKVSSCTNWYPQKLEVINSMIIRNDIITFKDIKTLKTSYGITKPLSTDWSYMFEGCTSLVHDILLPTSTTKAINCWKGCTSLTHVHSNWKQTYSSIVPTGCYAGCTEITHVDGADIGKSAYVNGLDDIPPEWGGYGFYVDYTTICVFEVGENSKLSLGQGAVLLDKMGYSGYKRIDWGDGNVLEDGVVDHTYDKPGTYVVKGFYIPNYNTYAQNKGYDHTRSSLTKVIKLPRVKLSYNRKFSSCDKLVYLDLSHVYTTDFNATLSGCSSLTNDNLIGLDKINTSQCSNMDSTFSGCSNLTSLDLSSWNLSNCTIFNSMFNGCSKLITPPITTFGNADSPTTDIGYSEMYGGCTFTAKGITFKVVGACTLYRLFVECKNLDSAITFEWNTDQRVDVSDLFCAGTNISVLGNFNLTSCVNLFSRFFFGGISDLYNTNLTTFNCYGVQSYSLNIYTLPNLSKESIMNIINCLCETTETLTLTLGPTNMAKLTEAEIAIATNKGWTIS